MGRLIFCVIFFLCNTVLHATVYTKVDDLLPTSQSSIHLLEGQTITLKTDKIGNWVKILPILQEYDNLKNGVKSVEPITYNIVPIENAWNDSILIIDDIKPGTYYFGNFDKISTTIISSKPIHLAYDNIIQLVVREDNSYLGFLTEQLNLPFIIPPKSLSNFGHQTDLNIGTDCAELAIYGKRRLGYDIPYVGPKGITKYLIPVDTISSGTILHFGFQVSILYEDRGKKGELDEDDLLIHAFEDKVKIQPLGDTKLFWIPCKMYQWAY